MSGGSRWRNRRKGRRSRREGHRENETRGQDQKKKEIILKGWTRNEAKKSRNNGKVK